MKCRYEELLLAARWQMMATRMLKRPSLTPCKVSSPRTHGGWVHPRFDDHSKKTRLLANR